MSQGGSPSFSYNIIAEASTLSNKKATPMQAESNQTNSHAHSSWIENIICALFATTSSLFYFLIVFIGLFIINNDYVQNNRLVNDVSDEESVFTNRSYLIVEIVALAIVVLESITKLAFTTKYSKKVKYILVVYL